ncbi:hypothetical protein ABTW24_16580 [Sphingobacterium thalpophilum]|uniref:Lipoprotein n=1 Tax=Sphingobacterium thalpophilum TaxID=259 RepID=A0A4U9VSQ0_9SPHI|nr:MULTISPECIES: hypothetical protein [Sphingobacterium]MCW8313705.1 hypothetical protein [Sphingobacterium sp. InxBP1]VTR49533.1 Uncharacterised protein [Sphingobacterium thalpophilum]
MKKLINLGLLAFVLTTFTVACGSAGKKKDNGSEQRDSTSSGQSKKDQPNTGCD